MAEVNMVTIPIEEYMDLREKANMNGFLMKELGQMDFKVSRYRPQTMGVRKEDGEQ